MRIFVANRSEVACRIFQAAREYGMVPFCAVTPQDEHARHASMADGIVRVASYTDPKVLVQAALQCGAQCVHPGYGFLAESALFADLVAQAGLIFIGPTAKTIHAVGDKIMSKKAAHACDVPTLPWAKTAPGNWQIAAHHIGFPLLVKASLGGGGRGMRVFMDEEALVVGSASLEREVIGDFFCERQLQGARHIEVQFFGDGMEHYGHIFDRECSLQRRHQKIWEEAPASCLDASLRQELYDATIRLARFAQYRGVGTAEFLVTLQGDFFFLEINPRLQVEHTVTEAVTGIDILRLQFELALGQSLPRVSQPRGHAIEVRIYAEDPMCQFAPHPGTVSHIRWPLGLGIRVESAIECGQTIGTDYDMLLAKIIVHAGDRPKALARLRYALDELVILGVETNQAYLRALCDAPDVIAWTLDTEYLDRWHWEEQITDEEIALLAQLQRPTLSTLFHQVEL